MSTSLLSLTILTIKELDADATLVVYRSFDGKAKSFQIHPQDLQVVKDWKTTSPVKDSETPEQRRARLTSEVLAAYGVEAGPGVELVNTSPTPPVVLGYEPESSARIESDARASEELRRLNLIVKKVELPFRINDDARDTTMTLGEAERLAFYCYDDKAGPDVNRAAFARLSQLPLERLMKLRKAIPRDLAMHIARVRCVALGSSPQGVGSDYMPPSWGAFVNNDGSDDQMMDEAGVSIPANPPPRENLPAIAATAPFLNRKATLSDVEARFAGMTFRGTENIK